MRRREFITLFASAAAACPLAARAQQDGRMRRIGLLLTSAKNDPAQLANLAAFREGLTKLGWAEGRNLELDLRFAPGDLDHIRSITEELVSLAPEVIFVASAAATRVVQARTKTIPIIFYGASTGAENAPVRDIARPEGNATGFQILFPSIGSKWLELLKEAAPHVDRVAVLLNADLGRSYIPSINEASPVLGMKVFPTPFRTTDDLQYAIDTFAAEPNGGLIVAPSAVAGARDSRQLVLLLAARHRLPTIHWDKNYPAEGGLMSYGSDPADLYRRAATYVDRLLRGAKVSDLPVQFPTKFELVVNLKAAKAIGLTIPETFLLRADEVIE